MLISFILNVFKVGLDSKRGLRQDFPTRWNSTYLMLSNAIYYKLAFAHLQITDHDYHSCPKNDEWLKVEKLNGFLEEFYELSKMLSGM